MIAGDYQAFDKIMGAILILAAFDIIIAVCKAAGYTEEDLMVIRGIAEDTSFAFTDFNGDLIQFISGNPSGHPLTVIINGLVNSLYMRYCYYELNPKKECKTFKQNVSLMTYGDDNIMGVSKKAEWFNHTTIQKCLADVGIVYTMAEKEAESVPYLSISKTTFVKRSWVYDKDVHAWLAPLDEDSIHRSLMLMTYSKAVSPEFQCIDIIASANREWWNYGYAYYMEKQKMLKEIVEECNLQFYVTDATFPTWCQLRDEFLKA
jgi:hypothetical protein